MEITSKLCFIAFLFFTNLAYAQKGYYVDKDSRINKYQNDIIGFLIQERQINTQKTPMKVTDYAGKIYIKKRLEIFGDQGNSVLLIQFGSLADHADKYWGLLSSYTKVFFYKVNDPKFLYLNNTNDSLTVNTISAYIKQATLN